MLIDLIQAIHQSRFRWCRATLHPSSPGRARRRRPGDFQSGRNPLV